MTLMLDVAYLPKHALFYSALERGFFEAEGLDVEIMPGSGSGNTVTAVETGKVDAGWADFGVTVTRQGQGADVKQVNLLQARSAYAVVALASSGISSWEDLRGKTVATEGGGAMTAMWPLALNKLGFKSSEVKVVHAAGSSKIQGLMANQWDANLALYVSDAPAIDALDRKASVLKWSELGIDMYGAGIVVSDSKLKNNPDQVKRFNRAMQRGLFWACANPNEAAQDFKKHVSGFEDRTVLMAIGQQCDLNWSDKGQSAKGYGTMTDAGAQKVINTSKRYLGLESGTDLEPDDVYTNEHLDPLRRNQAVQAP